VIRDAVEIIRQLLRGGSDHVGDVYTAKGAKLGWPAREIPIILAARGPRMMELAGEIADGLIIHGVSDGYIGFVKERVAVGAARAGRSPDECDVILQLHVEIAATRAKALENQRPESTIMAGGKYADSMIPLYGLDPTDLARLRKALAEGDPKPEQYVTDEMVEAFCVGGPLEYCADRLRGALEAGADRLIFGVYSGPAADIAEGLASVTPLIAQLARS
jgi:5,10-methylenetetrahydromethanopterin reductase